jgi:hypothetical protein
MVIANSDLSVRKQELTRDDIRGDIQYLLYKIQESNSWDIMELPEIKDLARIWEQLVNSKSIENCNHCINQIH